MNTGYPYKEITQCYTRNVSKKPLNGRIILLEEKFLFAYLCWKRLENRSFRYNKILDSVSVEDVLANEELRKLHADEHFFFQCCSGIYIELKYQIKNSVLRLPKTLMDRLQTLREEGRVHTHGVDWYWGVIDKKNPPISSKGANYDFDTNMKLLNEIYAIIVKELQ